MSSAETMVPLSECMSQRAASLMTGLTTYQLMRLATAGKIRTVSLPGVSIRYVKADVAKLTETRGEESKPASARRSTK